MEFIKFLFSGVWHFAGFVLLVLIVAAVIICVIREVKKPNQQKIKEAEANTEYWRSMARGYKYAAQSGGMKTLNTEKPNGGDKE